MHRRAISSPAVPLLFLVVSSVCSCGSLPLLSPPEETLTTSHKKPLGETLPPDALPFRDPKPLEEMAQLPGGEYVLPPGSYEMEMPSYCLHAGKGGGAKGTSYLATALEGPKAKLIKKIIERTTTRNLSQRDVQQIIWAVLARAKLNPESPSLGETIQKLFTPEEIKEINDDRLEVFSSGIMSRMQSRLPKEARDTLEAENKLRTQFEGATTSYDEMEAVAVPRSGDEGPALGTWTKTQHGYYIRFFPNGYQTTKVQIYVEPTKTAFRGGHSRSRFLLANEVSASGGTPAQVEGGDPCAKADLNGLVAAPDNPGKQRLMIGPMRNPGAGMLREAKTDVEIKSALDAIANQCEERVNRLAGYNTGALVPPEECAKLGTKKHLCAEDSINEASNPRVLSEVSYQKKGKGTPEPLPPRDTPEGIACRGKIYEELVNPTKPGKAPMRPDAPGTIATADCGGYMCADVVIMNEGATVPSKGNVSKAYDFKFPCGENAPKVSAKQKKKYKETFGEDAFGGHISPTPQ